MLQQQPRITCLPGKQPFSCIVTLFIPHLTWSHSCASLALCFSSYGNILRQIIYLTFPLSLVVSSFNLNFLLEGERLWILEHTSALCFTLRKPKVNSEPRPQSAHTDMINITIEVERNCLFCHPAHRLWQTI